MRRLLALVVVLGLGAASAQAAPPGRPRPAPQASDRAVGAACAGAGSAHTADVAVRGTTLATTWTIGDDTGIGLATSRDGGRTWSRRAAPLSTCTGGPLEFVLDPDLALGADGAPWLSASGNLPPEQAVSVSTGDEDGRVLVGVGDAGPVNVFPGVTTERGFLETHPTDPGRGWVLSEQLTRAFVAAGPTGRPVGAPRPGDALLLGTTGDRGRTWSRSVLRSAPPGRVLLALGLVRSGDALVALSLELDAASPAGLAALVSNEAPPSPLAAQTSRDGGRTWSDPVVLGVAQTSLVDASAGPGLVAVAAAQPDGVLLVWTSRDAGRTWRRTQAATGVARPTTGVAVDRRGRLSVLSYAAAGSVVTPQVSTSRDGGRTFGRPVAVAAPFDGARVVSGSHVAPVGPYSGADAVGDGVVVALVADDDRDGRTETRLARVG